MASEIEAEASGPTFSEAILGREFFHQRWLRRFMALPVTWRIVGAVAAFSSLLYIPYLGAVGLWDPWENHYGEVARMMIQRRDYVYPWWESAWFFSKPPLTMWIDVIGMQLVGTNRTEGPLALYTEWGMRLPFAFLSIGALCLLAVALYRTTNKRVAFATIFALSTMPMYWLLTRQAVTDTPFVATLVMAMSCAIIAQLDETTKHRTAWWYAFYVFCGFSMLAKGLLGFGLPAVILIVYASLCAMPWDAASINAHFRWLLEEKFRKEVREGKQPMPFLWNQFFKMRLGTGILVFFAVCGPWYAQMFAFEGVDDEGKLFWYRFLIHDHFNRLAAGVHTTTPGGTFIYFIEQGGYAMFPWVAAIPGAMAVVSRVKLRGGETRDHLATIAIAWASITFAIIGVSATKFHHYVFPVLPAAAILIGLFIDRLWEEGIPRHAVSLIFGLVLFILVGKDLATTPKDFTDLFVYNYDRPYPQELVERPLSLFGYRPLWAGDVLTVLLLAFGAYLLVEAFREKEKVVSSRATAITLCAGGVGLLVALSSGGRLSASLFLGLGIALGAIYLGYEGMQHKGSEKSSLFLSAAVLGVVSLVLIVSGTRPHPGGDDFQSFLTQTVNIKTELGVGFAVGGGLCAIAAMQRSKVMLFGSFWGLAFVFALWFNWNHWVDLSHNWTQRDQFWRYYKLRKPDEPITAFLMNWRGETFYSKNTVKQIKDNGLLQRYANLPGRKWALVEHARFGLLKTAVGADKVVTPIDPGLNNKFVLVTIE